MHLTQETGPRKPSPPAAREALLRVEDLRISFITRAGAVQAINDVSFEINGGESLGLVGETGCGKSQTAFAIMRLTPEAGIIEHGKIWFNGTNLAANIENEFKLIPKGREVELKRNKAQLKRLNVMMSHIRGKEIAMIFQEPMTSLNPVYTIGRQISEVLLTHSTDYLIDRMLARNSATKEQLTEIARIATTEHKDLVHDNEAQTELHMALDRYGLEGLEDQVTAITGRRDIGPSQKAESIVALGREKLKPSTVRYLSRAKRSQGGRILEYRIFDRIPLVKGLFYDAIRKEAYRVSYELLSRVSMPNVESVLSQYPHELSGGMRQRVMIAMAIAARPKLLIADEPTSALDVTVQAQILDLLRDLKSSLNTSVLFISHDLGVISEICDKVGVMYAGNIVEIARLDELFANPQHPYSQGLLAAIPKYGGKSETLETIKGSVPDLIDPPKGCRFSPRCPWAFDKCKEGPPWVKVGDDHYVLCWLYGDSERHVHQ
jgi:peptide/nickel transport system ATP-binding protein